MKLSPEEKVVLEEFGRFDRTITVGDFSNRVAAEIVRLRAELVLNKDQLQYNFQACKIIEFGCDELRTQFEAVTKERDELVLKCIRSYEKGRDFFREELLKTKEELSASRALVAKYRCALEICGHLPLKAKEGSFPTSAEVYEDRCMRVRVAQEVLAFDPTGESDLAVIRGAIGAMERIPKGWAQAESLTALKFLFGDGK